MTDDIIPSNYQEFLQTIKSRVQHAQLHAVLAVNRELILLYWHIGRGILERQKEQGWGTGVINQLSKDLHTTFPEMKGFSTRNLGYMKVFAKTYTDETFLQQVAAKLPWYHHCLLLDRVKDDKERRWYMEQSRE